MEERHEQFLRQKRGHPQVEEGEAAAEEDRQAKDVVRSQAQEKQVGRERDHKQGGRHSLRWVKEEPQW